MDEYKADTEEILFEIEACATSSYSVMSGSGFREAIAEYARQVAANAWDEGADAGSENESHWDGWRYLRDPIRNPYRITEEE